MESIAAIIRYGHEAGLTRYVTVTTTAIERMLRRAGVVTRRLGEPRKIGIETAVALYVEIEPTCQALFDTRLAS
jgi:acyl homoserine lactone synthase